MRTTHFAARLIFRLCLCCAALSVTLSASSVAAQTVAGRAPPVPESDKNYVLGPDDVIEVSVLGRTDFTTRGRIAADGTIQLPYLGSVPAGKRTSGQLADEVAGSLRKGGYFANPIIKVDIVSYASRYVIVLGDVRTPGLVPIDRAYRLSEIIARAGGVADTGADYVVLRPEGGAEQQLSIASLATGDTSQDPYVTAGDKIFVPHAELFYISGQVKAPGSYPLLRDMTLRMAIGRGGGLTDQGSDHHVKLTRHGANIAHPNLDDKLMPGDVIVVGESIF